MARQTKRPAGASASPRVLVIKRTAGEYLRPADFDSIEDYYGYFRQVARPLMDAEIMEREERKAGLMLMKTGGLQ